MVKNMFLVLYSYFFSIFVSGFDLHPYFAELGLRNNTQDHTICSFNMCVQQTN